MTIRCRELENNWFAIQTIRENGCLAVNLDHARLYDDDMTGILVLETS